MDFLTHKILHAGLSMASTIGSDAINSGQINWDKAFLACGVTVAAESTAEGALQLFHCFFITLAVLRRLVLPKQEALFPLRIFL
ncbi:hypothetical protein HE1_00178 [Holospora elegans E1]|uniref:Uncharacterized protein n=1 Tax=Holospora elegans E1 TaxID=1427503 RepID=A0A023DWP4_9PROT|nr:hypothetical protein HE1_00178 [Holospora elegans E1]